MFTGMEVMSDGTDCDCDGVGVGVGVEVGAFEFYVIAIDYDCIWVGEVEIID